MYTGWSRIHGTEMSINEDVELPQETEEVLPLKSERAHMFSVAVDAVAQPATVGKKKGLPRNSSSELLISADEMSEIEVEKPKLCKRKLKKSGRMTVEAWIVYSGVATNGPGGGVHRSPQAQGGPSNADHQASRTCGNFSHI
ncbi:uncharacterized protein TNCV_2162351 [Trichonephila clavipes]|nr:uncharacterized protein TNCV_2162351 [Trichonephila clavipes]